MKRTVEINHRQILIDGVPRQIVSGAVHYFRSLPETWDRVMENAKAFGLDAVETYIAWNLHEPRPGVFDFSGRLDFLRFLRCAEEHGLLAIVRPGPYICAEFDNGGLPAWLTARTGWRVRRDNPVYMDAVNAWFSRLLPMLAERQYTRGGNVILAAVENEYGSYGCDKIYLEKLRKLFLDSGFDIPLATADGGGDRQFTYGGMLPGCVTALTMGSEDCLGKFEIKRAIRPDDPDLCLEFWCGAYDQWGSPHRTVDADAVAGEFEAMLSSGASLNFYMFHGGTNFGFTSGVNFFYGGTGPNGGGFAPVTTSYDYNALLDEPGNPTPLYFRLRDILRKHRPSVPSAETSPAVLSPRPLGEASFDGCAPLFEHLDDFGPLKRTRFPESMESFGMNAGFLLYRARIQGPSGDVYPTSAGLWNLRDRAQLFLDGVPLGTLERGENTAFPFRIDGASATLDVLVENQGYISFGPALGSETKGVDDLLAGGGCNHFLTDIDTLPLPMDRFENLKFDPLRALPPGIPAFYHAVLNVDSPAPSFLRFPGVKGFVLMNGFPLGRYWNKGPGDALFVPAELLRHGRNEVIVFEQYAIAASGKIEFSAVRSWNPPRG